MTRPRIIVLVMLSLVVATSVRGADRKFGVFIAPGDADSNPVIDVLKNMVAGTSRFALASRETAEFEIYISCVRGNESVLACFSDVHYFHPDTSPLYAQVNAASGVVIASSSDNAAGLLLSQFLNGTSNSELEAIQKALQAKIVALMKRYDKDTETH